MAVSSSSLPLSGDVNSMMRGSYKYQERIVLVPASNNANAHDPDRDGYDTMIVSLESLASWRTSTWIHPFPTRLVNLLQLDRFSNIRRVRFQSSSLATTSYPDASGGAQYDFMPSPAGVSIIIDMDPEAISSDLDWTGLRSELSHFFVASGTTSNDPNHQPIYFAEQHRYIISFPTNGAAVSSDALVHFFRSLPCVADPSGSKGLFTDPIALSNLLVGNASPLGSDRSKPSSNSSFGRKMVWWNLERVSKDGDDDKQFHLSQGVRYSVAPSPARLDEGKLNIRNWQNWILPGTFIDAQNVACPWTDKQLQVFVATSQSAHQSSSSNNQTHLVEIEAFLNNSDLTTAPTEVTPSWTIRKTTRRHNGMANGGRFETVVTNSEESCHTETILRDVLPIRWMRPKWQTFQALVIQNFNASTSIQLQHTDITANVSLDFDDKSVHGAAGISIHATLPPHSSLLLSVEYDPTFLSFQNFPGDPNRGMEVFPAQADLRCILAGEDTTIASENWAAGHNEYVTLYSNTVLILPPVPDMSMPFNVTSLTCSLFAYVFGTIMALIVKKSSERVRYKLFPNEKPKSKIVKLKERIKAKLSGLRRSKTDESPSSSSISPSDTLPDATIPPPSEDETDVDTNSHAKTE